MAKRKVPKSKGFKKCLRVLKKAHIKKTKAVNICKKLVRKSKKGKRKYHRKRKR